MKKLFSTLLAGVMAASLVGCSSSGSASKTAGSAAGSADSKSEMKVAMITDYGDITDQSFNQTTHDTAKKWCEANGVDFTYKKPATNADQDRETSMEEAIEEGYNVILMPGFAFAKPIADVAPEHTDVKFVALDVSQYDLDKAAGGKFDGPNVFSAVYQEELAGYMAGYAAVKLGYKKLGYLGGMAVPAVQRYGYGYAQGADAAAKEMNLSDVTMSYVYGGAFNGSPDITAKMDTWISAGTELIFAAGGSIYTSAAEAEKNAGKGKIIGVDVDQAAIIDGAYGKGLTVTSAMKGLAPTVELLLNAIKDGKWSDYAGKIENLGIVDGDDPSKNFVQLPDSTQWADGKFTKDDYKKLVKGMSDGSVKVDSDVSKEPKDWTFDALKLTDEGSMG